MTRKKRRKHSNKMLYVIIAVLLAAVLSMAFFVLPAYGISVFSFFQMGAFGSGGSDGGGANQGNQQPSDEYWVDLEINPSRICVGDSTTASVTSNMPGAYCTIWYSVQRPNWNSLGNFYLDSNGRATASHAILQVGTAMFHVTCRSPLNTQVTSSDVPLTVEFCAEPPPSETCGSVVIPTSVGDKGGYCAEHGSCSLSGGVCDNYYDQINHVHKCGCTQTSFCGQYCFVYVSGTCDCPPGSTKQFVGLYDYKCVPSVGC